MSIGEQKTLSSSQSGGLEVDPAMAEGGEDKAEEAKGFLFGYLSTRATRDRGLSDKQARTFQNLDEQTDAQSGQATEVGKRLAVLGMGSYDCYDPRIKVF